MTLLSGIPVTSPLLLQEDETCRLWYKPDVDFRQPKLLPHFRLDSPALSTTPYHAVLTSLFVRYVKDTLTEMAYEAELAGMEYELGLHARALELFAGVYSENLPILVSKVLDQMLAMTSATYPLDEAVFQRVKDRTKRMYENLYLEEPYQHAVHQCSQLLETSRWSVDDKLRAIAHVSSTDLAAHCHFMFWQVFIEGFFYGNLALSAAPRLMEQVVQSFGFGRAERGALPLFCRANASSHALSNLHRHGSTVFNSASGTKGTTRRSQRKRVSRSLRTTTSTGLEAAMMLVGRAAGRPVEVIDDSGTFRRAMPLFPATNATTSVSTRSR
ncbi:hypothetical protein PsorP6_011876 [Peronosclerospora sorghi]|uniref:Uncharacterized protein n=1 Tax=Peronosclerospora sorghi TaxID=230839 RepID=A0ACC0WKL5_9STRA|nr:hypothetical protein PsorP6_011876 [Peronosclerospora sorghi]